VSGAANKAVTSGDNDESHFDPNYFAEEMKWHLPDLFGERSLVRACETDVYEPITERSPTAQLVENWKYLEERRFVNFWVLSVSNWKRAFYSLILRLSLNMAVDTKNYLRSEQAVDIFRPKYLNK
jgi:hypothetical protein